MDLRLEYCHIVGKNNQLPKNPGTLHCFDPKPITAYNMSRGRHREREREREREGWGWSFHIAYMYYRLLGINTGD